MPRFPGVNFGGDVKFAIDYYINDPYCPGFVFLRDHTDHRKDLFLIVSQTASVDNSFAIFLLLK